MMKEASSVSPFAMLSGAQQKEKWICWQCQQPAEPNDTTKPQADAPELPPLRLPEGPPAQQTMPEPPRLRHSQYDAVLRRMREADRRTARFQAWET